MSSATPPLEPVTGELVSPPLSPLRFGLRTLFAVMAVCGVQFALMSYVGVLQGFVLGTLACFAAFSAIFCVGLALPACGGTRYLSRLDQWIVWLMMALVALVFGTTLAGGGAILLYVLVSLRTEAWVRAQVGLSLRPMYVLEGGEPYLSQEVIAVFPASAAARAGLRRGDVIVWDGEHSNFHEMLDKNRGQDVELTVAAASRSLVLPPTSKRTVILSVPK